MKTFRILAAFGVLCAVAALTMSLFAPDAHAQAACYEYKKLQSALAEKFHEQPTNAGITGDKGQFAWTLFLSPKGESWTAVVVDTKGMACVVAAGQNWTDLSVGKGDPT